MGTQADIYPQVDDEAQCLRISIKRFTKLMTISDIWDFEGEIHQAGRGSSPAFYILSGD